MKEVEYMLTIWIDWLGVKCCCECKREVNVMV